MKTAVIGAGSWGTALAAHLARRGHPVRLWALEADVVDGIRHSHHNPFFLPELKLPDSVQATGNVAAAVASAELVVFVVPAQHARSVLRSLRPHLEPAVPIVSASKGIELGTLARLDELVVAELGCGPGRFVALSGPTFAREVGAGLPAAAVLAGHSASLCQGLQAELSGPAFRFYTSTDVVGVELAGALKNVIAIAAGMTAGLGLGTNALAALLTRGLHEITRLGVRLGGKAETFRGLAGMGDLVLTCTGELSRNRTVGQRLGRGEPLAAVLAGREVAEGVPTAAAAVALAAREGVEMPITSAVAAILAGRLRPRAALEALMSRDLKDEALL
ncbi:MAG: NAD(P)-dependent glycerol-3-phosphate dehydrogenase [Thermoanaerobaculaceae bacterium]|nr:NAD(P)-dependent glycerol-3-phosphate dehydrogenase [Thermoanaerobaculaceae bacterium]MDI9622971.1 NAD(P)H-dependent glycerol-3-phosphate dehydrogenase [Acidobacteriota bacterium]HPW54950.1 NAD(P)H-dependent glycerol-3-phosphate dehydrogenase [Thermoanaerobaculaceae bacterium]